LKPGMAGVEGELAQGEDLIGAMLAENGKEGVQFFPAQPESAPRAVLDKAAAASRR